MAGYGKSTMKCLVGSIKVDFTSNKASRDMQLLYLLMLLRLQCSFGHLVCIWGIDPWSVHIYIFKHLSLEIFKKCLSRIPLLLPYCH